MLGKTIGERCQVGRRPLSMGLWRIEEDCHAGWTIKGMRLSCLEGVMERGVVASFNGQQRRQSPRQLPQQGLQSSR